MATYTRLEAASLLAVALGLAGDGKYWLCGWSAHEITCGVGCSHPQNNLWACGEAAPGATDWNPAGVKNYPVLPEAIAATAANLNSTRFPEYQRMLGDLTRGVYDSANVRAGLARWCGSSCYSASAGSFVASGKSHAGDLFDDSGGGKFKPNTDLSCVPCGIQMCCPPKVCIGGGVGGIDAQCVDKAAANVIGNPCAVLGLPDWLCNSNGTFKPDWQRITKAALGVLLIGFGLFLVGAILLGKAESNPAVKAVSSVAAMG